MTTLESLSFNLREDKYPYFSEAQLEELLARNENDLRRASYEGLLLKAEDDTVALPGLSVASSQGYFLRLAAKFRTPKTGTTQRADE